LYNKSLYFDTSSDKELNISALSIRVFSALSFSLFRINNQSSSLSLSSMEIQYNSANLSF